LADPNFVDVPVKRLTSDEYLRSLAAKINPSHTQPPDDYGSTPPDDHGTSHFCVIDAHGNAVSCTETINLEYGSLVGVSKYGFALNDEMDDFTTKRGQPNAFGLRQSDRNLPAPGKRPLSSMTPTIALDRDGRVALVVGASGGPKIITATTQVILSMNDAHFAVAMPRFHHQWMPDVIQMERDLYAQCEADGTNAQLRAMGHAIEPKGILGIVQLIRRVNGGYDAACDPRKGGRPAGF
jgi:gamma-glutamyltranspeptidase/glutathione hydrolase